MKKKNKKKASYTGKEMPYITVDKEATYGQPYMTGKEATYTGKEMLYMTADKEIHLCWEGDALYGSRQGSHLHWE